MEACGEQNSSVERQLIRTFFGKGGSEPIIGGQEMRGVVGDRGTASAGGGHRPDP